MRNFVLTIASAALAVIGFVSTASAQYSQPRCPQGTQLVRAPEYGGRPMCLHPRRQVQQFHRPVYREQRVVQRSVYYGQQQVPRYYAPPRQQPVYREAPPMRHVVAPVYQALPTQIVHAPPAFVNPRPAGLSPSATVGESCSQKDCVITPFQAYLVKKGDGTAGRFGNCTDVPNNGAAKVVRCKDTDGFTAVFAHDPQGRLREVKHDR